MSDLRGERNLKQRGYASPVIRVPVHSWLIFEAVPFFGRTLRITDPAPLVIDLERRRYRRVRCIRFDVLGIVPPYSQDTNGDKNQTESDERYHGEPKKSRLIRTEDSASVVIFGSEPKNASVNDGLNRHDQEAAAKNHRDPAG